MTDQTSAHDALNGYVPNGMSLEEALELRAAKPSEYVERSRESMTVHCRAMVDLKQAGAVVFDYGNGLRGQAQDMGFADAFAYPYPSLHPYSSPSPFPTQAHSTNPPPHSSP